MFLTALSHSRFSISHLSFSLSRLSSHSQTPFVPSCLLSPPCLLWPPREEIMPPRRNAIVLSVVAKRRLRSAIAAKLFFISDEEFSRCHRSVAAKRCHREETAPPPREKVRFSSLLSGLSLICFLVYCLLCLLLPNRAVLLVREGLLVCWFIC